MWIKFNTDYDTRYLDFSKLSLITIKEEKDLFEVKACEAGTEYNWTIATYRTKELAEKFVDYLLSATRDCFITPAVFNIPTEEELLLGWRG